MNTASLWLIAAFYILITIVAIVSLIISIKKLFKSGVSIKKIGAVIWCLVFLLMASYLSVEETQRAIDPKVLYFEGVCTNREIESLDCKYQFDNQTDSVVLTIPYIFDDWIAGNNYKGINRIYKVWYEEETRSILKIEVIKKQYNGGEE